MDVLIHFVSSKNNNIFYYPSGKSRNVVRTNHTLRRIGQYGKVGRYFRTSSSPYLLIWQKLKFRNICQVFHTA